MSVPANAIHIASSLEGMHRRLRTRKLRDRLVESLLLLAALVAVFTTAAIVYILVSESVPFFAHVSFRDFFTDRL